MPSIISLGWQPRILQTINRVDIDSCQTVCFVCLAVHVMKANIKSGVCVDSFIFSSAKSDHSLCCFCVFDVAFVFAAFMSESSFSLSLTDALSSARRSWSILSDARQSSDAELKDEVVVLLMVVPQSLFLKTTSAICVAAKGDPKAECSSAIFVCKPICS